MPRYTPSRSLAGGEHPYPRAPRRGADRRSLPADGTTLPADGNQPAPTVAGRIPEESHHADVLRHRVRLDLEHFLGPRLNHALLDRQEVVRQGVLVQFPDGIVVR